MVSEQVFHRNEPLGVTDLSADVSSVSAFNLYNLVKGIEFQTNSLICRKLRVRQASSTRIRKFVKTQIFFYEYGLRPHVSSVFSGRIRKFLKTLSRVEIFLSDTNTYTCGRSYPEIFEYAFVILLDPVFTASIINKHGVQQAVL